MLTDSQPAVDPAAEAPDTLLPARPWSETPAGNALAGLIYLMTFSHIYRTYISPTWGYTGLHYSPLSFWEIAFEAAAVGLTSLLLPTRIDRPSALIVWLLYAFVFVPTTAITFMIGINPAPFYVTGLGALALAIILCAVVSRGSPTPVPRDEARPPASGLIYFLLAGYGILAASLLVAFGDTLSFAAIDDVYTQRFAASEIGGGVIGYFRTYFTYVFSGGLLAVGLTERRWRWLIAPGIGGYILTYMIDASKIALIIPLAMLVLAGTIALRRTGTALFTGALAALAAVTSLFTNYSAFVRFLVDLVLLRSIAIPGQTFSQYYDLFSARGYTFWSNTKVINLIVPPPPAFSADPAWPVLGYIVGAEFYGNDSRMNANANLFAGEGIAAAGPIGVLVIACALAVWLRYLDRYSARWDRTFALTVMMPIGLGLTNAHLTTLLLSFGGLFWLLAFRFGTRAGPAAP